MSTGIVLTGLPNIYPQVIQQMISQLGVENIKIYGVFWNTQEGLFQHLTSMEIFEEIHLVKPFLEDSFLPDAFWKFKETVPETVLSMFLLREKCLHLINFEKNDNWIITRPDLSFSHKLKLNMDKVKKGYVLIPEEGNFRNGLTDTFICGNSTNIKIYLSILHRLRQILKTKESLFISLSNVKEFLKTFYYIFSPRLFEGSSLVPFHPESVINKDLINNGLKIGRFKTGGIILYRENNSTSILHKQTRNSSVVLNIQKSKFFKSLLNLDVAKHFYYNRKR